MQPVRNQALVATIALCLLFSHFLAAQSVPGGKSSHDPGVGPNRPLPEIGMAPPTPDRSLTLLDVIGRWLSADIRRIDADRDRVLRRIRPLPKLISRQNGSTLGYHSRVGSNQRWVQVDLGSSKAIDAVVLIPAQAIMEADPGPGYGFPIRFRVDISDDLKFESYETVADRTDADFENPADSPVYIETPGKVGRYVRVTATKLWSKKDNPLFALGELVVLQGPRNIAAGCTVTATDSIDNPPNWALQHLVDSQSMLGLPVSQEPSSGNGWHTKEFERNPTLQKWVQVDLGQTSLIDQVCLIPARPINYADIIGFGFPVRFRIDVSDDPEFSEAKNCADFTQYDFPNPGDNAVTVSAPDKFGRFLRVTATLLWERTKDYAFALSELQVYSGNTNVALGSTVTASESHEGDGWSTRFLVDGFNSQYRLIALPEWLKGLALRRELSLHLRRLESERERVMERLLRRIAQWGGGSLLVAILCLGFLGYRYRIQRLRELDRLRNRIAGDLHDELGASLTQIGMLGELAKRDLANPSAVETHADKIAIRAREAVRALDEVVWTVNPKNDTLAHLVGYFLQYAEQFFEQTSIQCRVDRPPDLPTYRLSTDVRHNLLMAFKEAINNVLKHSAATEVWIRVSLDSSVMTVRIEDNGVGGLNQPGVRHGNGIGNMRQRMAEINGVFKSENRRPSGTMIQLRVPIR